MGKSRKATNVTPKERAKIAALKIAGGPKATQKNIAKQMGRSQTTVSMTNYDMLPPEEKELADQYLEQLEALATRDFAKGIRTQAKLIAKVDREEDTSKLGMVTGANKFLYDTIRLAGGKSTSITEHRQTDLDLAKKTMMKLIESGHFNKRTAIKAAAEAYKIEPKLLTEGNG